MQFSPLPRHLVPLGPKYILQHPYLEHPQTFLLQYDSPSSLTALYTCNRPSSVMALYTCNLLFTHTDTAFNDADYTTKVRQLANNRHTCEHVSRDDGSQFLRSCSS